MLPLKNKIRIIYCLSRGAEKGKVKKEMSDLRKVIIIIIIVRGLAPTLRSFSYYFIILIVTIQDVETLSDA